MHQNYLSQRKQKLQTAVVQNRSFRLSNFLQGTLQLQQGLFLYRFVRNLNDAAFALFKPTGASFAFASVALETHFHPLPLPPLPLQCPRLDSERETSVQHHLNTHSR
jgi:hypothetical protein